VIADEGTERRLDLKVGAFTLVILILGAAVVLVLGQRRHVFEPRVTLHARFADVGGLREGAPVWLSGVNVGTVTRVRVGQSGARLIDVDLEVQKQMVDRIHRDSVASIGSQGLLGDKLLQISLGSPAAMEVEPGETLQSVAPADFNKLVDQASAILDRARVIADNLADVMHELADPKTVAAFRGSMASIRDLLEQAKSGQGLAHSIFYKKESADNFERLTRELNKLVDHVNEGVKNLDAVLATTDGEGRQVINNLSRAAKGVGEAASELQRTRTIANLEKASKDLSDITGYVKSGHGTIGALVSDPTVYEQLVQVLGGVQRSRILRALVRYAISRDEGRSAGREILDVKAPAPAQPEAVPKPSRAKR
jgi:phospholipid/cholesterol/gamma-HCH transport system substrate-binding protein